MIVVLDVSVAREESVYALQGTEKTMVSTTGMLLGVFDFLKSEGKQMSDVEGVVVVLGQGRFTSTRTATIVANGCALVLGTPVISVTAEDLADAALVRKKLQEQKARYVAPAYYAPPNITQKKSLLKS